MTENRYVKHVPIDEGGMFGVQSTLPYRPDSRAIEVQIMDLKGNMVNVYLTSQEALDWSMSLRDAWLHATTQLLGREDDDA